jgi:ParB/RepB/Spo0J family partition protein
MTMLTSLPIANLVIAENVRQGQGLEVESLQELAASIAMYGVIQPINVHRTRAGYTVLAGHRRVMASQLAGLETIPAYVSEAPPSERTARQLAENMHRTDLSIADMAAAVRDLYDTHGSVGLVAEALGRSKSWVSKHLALTADADAPTARRMVADGSITDLEIAHLIAQLEKAGRRDMGVIEAALRDGKHTRATLRRLLTETKTAALDNAASEHDEQGELPVTADNAPKPTYEELRLALMEACALLRTTDALADNPNAILLWEAMTARQ